MLGNDATWVKGVKDTGDPISQEKPLEIGDKIWMHDPNRNKGLAWALRNGKRNPTTEHVYGHLEDVPFSSWITFDGATETSQGDASLVFESGASTKIGLGSRLFNPRTEEILRINAAMSSTTTTGTTSGDVTRNFGRGIATDYLVKGDKLFILPPAHEQGFPMQDGLSNAMTYSSFVTSEISYPVQVANIEKAEKSRGGDPFKRALKKQWKHAKDQMEGELLFSGQKNTTGGGGAPVTASDGIANFVTTNVWSAKYLSMMDFIDILGEWSAINHDGGAIFCSMAFKQMVAQWAINMSSITVPISGQTGDGKIGLVVDTIKTPAGEFDLIDIDLLNQDPYLMGMAMLVPQGRIEYRPLIHYENYDLRYYPVSRDEIHAHEGEIYGVYGWEFFEEEMWGMITGLDFAA